MAGIATLFVAGACADLTGIEDRLDKLEQNVTDLTSQANANKNAIAALTQAVSSGNSIVSYQEISGGYTLNLSDGSTITIYNGQNGADGKDGKDGQNGANGADGKDGKDGLDGANGADGKDGEGDAFFEEVVFSEEYAVFYLTDGRVIVVPMVDTIFYAFRSP